MGDSKKFESISISRKVALVSGVMVHARTTCSCWELSSFSRPVIQKKRLLYMLSSLIHMVNATMGAWIWSMDSINNMFFCATTAKILTVIKSECWWNPTDVSAMSSLTRSTLWRNCKRWQDPADISDPLTMTGSNKDVTYQCTLMRPNWGCN